MYDVHYMCIDIVVEFTVSCILKHVEYSSVELCQGRIQDLSEGGSY